MRTGIFPRCSFVSFLLLQGLLQLLASCQFLVTSCYFRFYMLFIPSSWFPSVDGNVSIRCLLTVILSPVCPSAFWSGLLTGICLLFCRSFWFMWLISLSLSVCIGKFSTEAMPLICYVFLYIHSLLIHYMLLLYDLVTLFFSSTYSTLWIVNCFCYSLFNFVGCAWSWASAVFCLPFSPEPFNRLCCCWLLSTYLVCNALLLPLSFPLIPLLQLQLSVVFLLYFYLFNLWFNCSSPTTFPRCLESYPSACGKCMNENEYLHCRKCTWRV